VSPISPPTPTPRRSLEASGAAFASLKLAVASARFAQALKYNVVLLCLKKEHGERHSVSSSVRFADGVSGSFTVSEVNDGKAELFAADLLGISLQKELFVHE